MANTVLVGAQWGDEGKGKIIDVLAEEADWVVRFQGGNNAGHTVEIGSERYVLHLIPSGILHPGKMCVIGNGVVVDPVALLEEIDGVEQRGIVTKGRLFVSDRAHLVFPYHKLIDEYRERKPAAGTPIGTTKRGIGPTYGDKAARVGVRVGDMLDPDFANLLRERVEANNKMLIASEAPTLDVEETVATYLAVAQRLAPYIADTIPMIHDAMAKKQSVLLEGAQGTLLDIDFGTYPFVTSSNATSGGACTGSGMPPNRIDRVIGVVKAYSTRVGEGPFPTELHDAMGEHIRKVGHEFGATTGRPRRCGWFDLVVARYAAHVNGVTDWAVTKLDVLDDVEEIKVCVAYECDGRRYEHLPASARVLARCKPVYESFPGWKTSTKSAQTLEDLPKLCRSYLNALARLTGTPISILSNGPRRESTMRLDLAAAVISA
ncbi:MAG: adenylosuccinate synthase [Kiritimatiellae bacterium]|nr:adenylosuccinate synthase [Kiritimatiellia bacterium]